MLLLTNKQCVLNAKGEFKIMKKKVIALTLASGVVLGSTATYAATNWFSSLLDKSVSEVNSVVPDKDYEAIFQKEVDAAKETVQNEVGDLTEEQKQNVKAEIKYHEDQRISEIKEKFVGSSIKTARQTLTKAGGEAQQKAEQKIDEAYNKVLANNGLSSK